MREFNPFKALAATVIVLFVVKFLWRIPYVGPIAVFALIGYLLYLVVQVSPNISVMVQENKLFINQVLNMVR